MLSHPPSSDARHLALPGYIIALMLVVTPIAGIFLATAVPGPEGTIRRIRFVTLVVDSGLLILLGVYLGAMLSVVFGHRKTGWSFTVASAIIGLSALAIMPMYALDAIQLRSGVADSMRLLYDGNAVRTLGTLSAIATALLLLAFFHGRALLRAQSQERAAAPAPNLVGSVSRQTRDAEAPPAKARS